MKENNLVKILIILVIIAISLISFLGINKKDKNRWINILPNYLLSTNLKGARVTKLELDSSTKEVIYDSEGNIVEDGKNEDGTLKEGYTNEDKKVNPDELLTKENFLQAKQVLENRLKKLGVQDYKIRQNYENGEIIIEIPEDTTTDDVISNFTYKGNFEIQDSETKEVLLNSSHIKEAKAAYGTSQTGVGTSVYLSMEFNKEGKEKLREITKKYIQSTDEEGNIKTKNISIKVDDQELTNTYFSEEITTGILSLSMGVPTTDEGQLSQYIEQARYMAAIIDSGKMELKYDLKQNQYISTTIDEDLLKNMIFIFIIPIIIAGIYFVIKYKDNGIMAIISTIGLIGFILLTLRYTNVLISLEAIVGIITVIILQVMFIEILLNKINNSKQSMKESIKETYIKLIPILVPLLIIAITFTFTNWVEVASIGMTMFWGIIIILGYNYIFTKNLFVNKKVKE
ncbi:MAG: hypothetical protein HFJ53_01840 [Clostridia bacterium]|jgi:preprotein translocase subunit SecD|nr:hypothetical protein [Clostridia bacterium]